MLHISTCNRPIAIKLGKVVTRRERISSINLHNPLNTCWQRSRDKSNMLYFHLQNTHGNETRQDADLQWEAPILKATLPFDHLTNVKIFKKLIWKSFIFTRLIASNLTRCLFMGGGSVRKPLSRHWLLVFYPDCLKSSYNIEHIVKPGNKTNIFYARAIKVFLAFKFFSYI